METTTETVAAHATVTARAAKDKPKRPSRRELRKVAAEGGMPPLTKLAADVKASAAVLTVDEVRYVVDLYYQLQEYRIRSQSQVRLASEGGEPSALLAWIYMTLAGLEQEIQGAMERFTDAHPVGRWSRSITGIGPILAAGLLARLRLQKPAQFHLRDAEHTLLATFTAHAHGIAGNALSVLVEPGGLTFAVGVGASGAEVFPIGAGEDAIAALCAAVRASSRQVTATFHAEGHPLAHDWRAMTGGHDIRSAGHIWSFCGLNPDVEWLGKDKAHALVRDVVGKAATVTGEQLATIAAQVHRPAARLLELAHGTYGEDGPEVATTALIKVLSRPPYSLEMKVLAYKIGASFEKSQNRPTDFYGKLYAQRKLYEQQRNAAGYNRPYAEKQLASGKRFDKSKAAYKAYSEGRIPDGQIRARAMRWATKIFLAHWFEVAYETLHGEKAPAPYPIAIQHHADTHRVPVPNRA